MIYVYLNRMLPPENPGGFAGIEGEGAPAMVLEYDLHMPQVGDRMFLGPKFNNASGVVREIRHYLNDDPGTDAGEHTSLVITSDNKRVWVPVHEVIGVAIRIDTVS